MNLCVYNEILIICIKNNNVLQFQKSKITTMLKKMNLDWVMELKENMLV